MHYENSKGSFDERTIYSKFIKTFNFDNQLDIPDYLLSICSSKPSDYNPYDELYDKMNKLKRQGFNLQKEDLEILITIIGARQSSVFIKTEEPTFIDKLAETFSNLVGLKDIIDEHLIDNISILLKEEHGGEKKLSNASENVYNRLKVTADKLYSNIEYEIEQANMPKKQVKKAIQFISDITSWKSIDVSIIDTDTITDESVDRVIDSVMFNILFMTNIMPNILEANKLEYFLNIDYSHIAKYWNLSGRHYEIIKDNIRLYYTPFKQFIDNRKLQTYIKGLKDKTSELEKIVRLIKHNYKKTDSYPILSKVIVLEFIRYIYYIYLTILIEHVSEEDDELYKSIIDYIIIMQIHFEKEKKTINMSKQDIKQATLKLKEQEKDVLTKKLQELSDEERKVQTLLKAHKLEDWNIGLQKGLTTYDKDFYDKELSEQELIDQEIEKEEYSLDHLPEDDDYGDHDY